MSEVRERVFEECRQLGEQGVKQRINDRVYNRQKQTYAEEWLEGQARLRSEASNAEQMRVTRSAKNAAWAAAIAAMVAATATAVMAVIAYWTLSS